MRTDSQHSLATRRHVGAAALCSLLLTQLAACDVGRSVLAPLDDIPDATVDASDASDVGDDRPTDGAVAPDASTGTRTCADFARCAGSCMDGAGFGACLTGCARELRPSSQRLADDLLTCVRASCDAGVDATCAGMAVAGPCGSQLAACMGDGAPPDGGPMDVPPGDAPSDTPPPIDAPMDTTPPDAPTDTAPPPDAPADVVVPPDLPVGGLGCMEGFSACPVSCPERDVDCIRRCASGMRASSMTIFNSLVTCLADACGASSSFSCFQVIALSSTCSAQVAACMMDSAGMPPAPPCAAPWESRCGADCVNTSYRNTSHCGRCGAACMAGETCSFGECVPHGHTSISLQWHALGDVDLVVRTACGDVVSARHPSACGATFDRSNATGIGPESISFAAAPRAGRYSVCAIPRTALRGDHPGARVALDRAGMPLVLFPTPMGDPLDRSSGTVQPIPAAADTTTDDCDPMGPYHIADIDL